MSKSSTATSRDEPVVDVSSSSGILHVHARTFTVDSDQRIQVIDMTEPIMSLVRGIGIREGTVNLFSLHTTCAVFINEFQQALVADIGSFLESMVARNAGWLHNDPAHSDCDRMNADSHLRAMLLGHSLTLQVGGGEVVLGQWQRILMAELDGPRARTVRIQMVGI